MTSKNTFSVRRDRFIVGVAVCAIASGVFGAVAFTPVLAKTKPAHTAVIPVERAGFADLVEAVSPAVVHVAVSGTVPTRGSGIPDFNFPPGSPFEDFFDQF